MQRILNIERKCLIISECLAKSTRSKGRRIILIIFSIFILICIFFKIIFWVETGSFHRTIIKSDLVEIAIECDSFDVLAVGKELESYAKKYTDVEVELKYIEYSFKKDEITAMYGFKGRTYRKGRGETIRFYLDINKKNLYEISYYAAGGKEFSSYPSQYFNTDINMMDEYKKLKANSDCNLAKEIKFILSNNNCEPIIVY